MEHGYRLYDSPAEVWMQEAIPADGAFVQVFRSLARELDMAIGVTLLERWPGGPRNTLVLIDRRGKVRLTYAKVHTCDFDVERHLTPGEAFCVAELDTACGPVKVGAMICYDREFPESAPHPYAAGGGADPGAQRLPDGDQPPFPAAGARL